MMQKRFEFEEPCVKRTWAIHLSSHPKYSAWTWDVMLADYALEKPVSTEPNKAVLQTLPPAVYFPSPGGQFGERLLLGSRGMGAWSRTETLHPRGVDVCKPARN